MNQILVRVYYEAKLRDLPYRLRLQVHDNILTQVRKKDVDDFLELSAKCFNYPLTIKHKTFVVPYDTDIMLNWGTKFKN